MFKFFDWFIEQVNLLWDFFLNIIESLISLITVIYTSLSSVTMLLAYMPPLITVSILLVLSITVLNYIVGRSNQS